jgi:hypothetical protein
LTGTANCISVKVKYKEPKSGYIRKRPEQGIKSFSRLPVSVFYPKKLKKQVIAVFPLFLNQFVIVLIVFFNYGITIIKCKRSTIAAYILAIIYCWSGYGYFIPIRVHQATNIARKETGT